MNQGENKNFFISGAGTCGHWRRIGAPMRSASGGQQGQRTADRASQARQVSTAQQSMPFTFQQILRRQNAKPKAHVDYVLGIFLHVC